MLNITPLGSCRIATPLKLCEDRYGYTTNRSRSYGFSHSSAEVVQQLRFMLGEITPPEEVWRFLARQMDRGAMLSRAHSPSDLYVVEISSAKQILLGGWLIQLNYLVSQMHDFFSSKERGSAYWKLIDAGDQAKIDAFLSETYRETPEQIEDSEILRQIRRSLTSEEDLRADVTFLMERLRYVLFVTHVNALRPDGTPIPSREELIGKVEAVVTSCGGRVYNPTRRMQELTQPVAIEDHSDSLAHFTPEFSQVIVDDWFSNDVLTIIDEIVGTEDEARIGNVFVPHFEALIVSGLFDGLEERLDALMQIHPASPTLMELQCKLYMSLNKVEKAFATATTMIKTCPEDNNLLSRYADIALELRHYHETVEAYSRLVEAGHPVSPTRLHDCGQRAEHDGHMTEASHFYSMALIQGNDRSNVVENLGNLLISTGDIGLWNALSADAQTAALQNFEPRLLMDISQMIETNFTKFISINNLSVDDLVIYLDQLDTEGRVDEAGDMVRQWREENGISPAHPKLRAIVESWFQTSEASETLEQRLELLNTVLNAYPSHAGARVALRNIRRDVLATARELAGQKDRDSLEQLALQTQTLPYDLPELALYRARMAFDEQDYAIALEIGEIAVRRMHDSVSLWALLMRSAFNLEDYVATDYFASQVISNADAATERLESEAEKRRSRTPLLCYRAARGETDNLRLISLYRIAERHEEYGEDAARKKASAELSIINELRELQISNDVTFVPYLDKILNVMDNDPKVLMSAGRYFVKNKDFSRAAEFWKALLNIDPTNEEVQFQYERCLERLSETVQA